MTTVPSLQVLLKTRPGERTIAGLPCAVRSAFRAGTELSPARVSIAGADAEFLKRWEFPLRASGAQIGDGVDENLPLLAVEADAFPDEKALNDFLSAAEPLGRARRLVNGRAVAVYARDTRALGAGRLTPADLHARVLSEPAPEVAGGAFFDGASPETARAAESALYARLWKANDGYLARFDRRLSLLLTRLMLPFPISPNQVTTVSLALGLLGAWWLAAPSAGLQFAGALTLWFCCLLDGCDGEIARLKHHITPHGGDFDLFADHVAHLATFVALPIGVARLHPGLDWWTPGVLLVTGFLASGFSVWWRVLRVPENERGDLALVVERVASRDYVYLLVALSAVGRLDWFVWTAAVGSHVFWAWLWWAGA